MPIAVHLSVWHVYTMEYSSAIKKDEIMPFSATWMELEMMTLSEISQTKKDKHMILLIYGILRNDTNELIYKTETD